MANYTIEARSLDIVGVASHNFWVLRDPAGRVIGELHGLATDRATHQFVPIGTDPNLFSLSIWQFNKQVYTASGQDFKIVYSSSAENVLAKWNAAVQSIGYINHLDLDYPSLIDTGIAGANPWANIVNSNSAFRTLGEIMGLPITDFPNKVEPGLDNRMLTPQQIENLGNHSDNFLDQYNSLNPEDKQIVAAMWDEDQNGMHIRLDDDSLIGIASNSLDGLGNVISGTRTSSDGNLLDSNSAFFSSDGTLLGNILYYDPTTT